VCLGKPSLKGQAPSNQLQLQLSQTKQLQLPHKPMESVVERELDVDSGSKSSILDF